MKICLASHFGEGAWLAWLMGNEGHNVEVVVSEERYAEALKGLINVVGGEVDPKGIDLAVFDVTGNGEEADGMLGTCPVIGDSELADFLEQNRRGALEFMQRCGLQVAPWEEFDNPADGIKYIKKRNRRLVFKPTGEQDDKATTYVARDANDMLRYFDVLFRTAKVKQFILQDFVEGVEISTEVYLNATGYYALNHTLETKKFMNGDLGPNTGCSGSLCWMAKKDNVVFEKGLKKCVGPLQELDYVGPIDLNTIVNPEGVWALEYTSRFGYDATALLTRLLPIPFGDFLYAIASGQRPPDTTAKHPFCASVRLSIPPYPCEGLPEKAYKAGVPIEGLTEADLEEWFIYDVRKRGESDELESAGLCGWLGSPLAVGDTAPAAFEKAYAMLKAVHVPQQQYRTDVCDNACKRYWQLREGGYLK